jgi:hypothetical protein
MLLLFLLLMLMLMLLLLLVSFVPSDNAFHYSKSSILLQQGSKPFPHRVPVLLQKQTAPIDQTNLWREANCSCDFSRLSSKGKMQPDDVDATDRRN